MNARAETQHQRPYYRSHLDTLFTRRARLHVLRKVLLFLQEKRQNFPLLFVTQKSGHELYINLVSPRAPFHWPWAQSHPLDPPAVAMRAHFRIKPHEGSRALYMHMRLEQFIVLSYSQLPPLTLTGFGEPRKMDLPRARLGPTPRKYTSKVQVGDKTWIPVKSLTPTPRRWAALKERLRGKGAFTSFTKN